MIFFGDLRSWDDYVMINANGNFRSITSVTDSNIDVEDLADWMIENDHHAFNDWLMDNYPEEEE